MVNALACLPLLLGSATAFRSIPEYQQAVSRLSASYVSPNNQEQAAAINSTLLCENVVVRVDTTESYMGREKGTEYIWGLFANAEKAAKAGVTQLLPFPVGSTLASLVVQPPMVASSTIGNFSWPTINYFLPLQMDSFIRFNDADMKVNSWDVIFRRYAESWDWMLENTPLLKQIAKEDKIRYSRRTDTTFLLANHAAKDVCKVHEEFCKGSNKQHRNERECYSTLMDKKFGKPWQLGHDTLFCRYIHKYMIPSRPAVHCPHIGKTGGGMCASNNYLDRVLKPPFTQPLIGGR